MKTFNGKAIYNPSGKAGEYSYWACNFYTGCSNGCDYCYCKKGILAKVMGGNVPVLKKCFRDEEHALEVFEKELKQNISELRKYGLFFSFTTDPMLVQTSTLTICAMVECVKNEIPVKILTKVADFIDLYSFFIEGVNWLELAFQSKYGISINALKEYVAFGFTLTGCDDREPNASTNIERIKTMEKLHDAGFKTWASIEPVIDIPKSLAMINLSNGLCDLYKIGLMSGKRYSKTDLQAFVEMLTGMYPNNKFYFKDTLLSQADIARDCLPSNCVGRDYNIFNENPDINK